MPNVRKPVGRTFIWLGVGVLLFVLLIHLVAVQVLRSQLEAFLHPQEGQGTYLGDVHLNLFSGLLSIEGVEVRDDQRILLQASELLVDIDPLALFSKRLHVQQVALVGGRLRVDRHKDGSLHALVPLVPNGPAASEEVSESPFGVTSEQISVSRFTIDYVDALAKGPESLRIERLDVKGPLQIEKPELAFALEAGWQATQLKTQGTAELADSPSVSADLLLQRLPLHKALALARVEPVAQVGVSAKLNIRLAGQQLASNGDLQLDGIAWSQGIQQLAVGQLNAQRLKLQLPLDSPDQLQVQGADLNAQAIQFDQGDTLVNLPSARAKGEWRVDLATKTFNLADLELSIQGVSASLGQQHLEVANTAVKLQADQASFSEPKISGALQLSGLQARMPQLPEDALAIDAIDLAHWELDGEHVKLGKLQAEKLGMRQFPLSINHLMLSEASIKGPAIALGQVIVTDLRAKSGRDANGRLLLPVMQAAMAGRKASVESAAASDPVNISLAGVQVTGDSRIHFRDESIKPAIDRDIRIKQFELGAMDSGAAGNDTAVKVALAPDEYTELKINGQLRPFSDDVYLNLDGQLSGLELALLNGLVRDDLGHRFLNGHLEDTFDLHIEKRHLKMENQLALQDLDVEAIEGKDGPPLSTAIALLEDTNGRIELGVPVEGDLDNPDFKVLGALNPIIAKAVAGAAALAIQPFGSVALVGSLLAGQAMKVSFEPAVFDPMTAELKNADMLKKLTGILKEKPKLKLRLCGIAVQVDRTRNKKGEFVETKEQLLALAEQRVKRVREVMLGAGASEKQLRGCRPILEEKPETRPRVDIRL